MTAGLLIAIYLLIGLILLGTKLAVGAQKRKLEETWLAFAEQMGWEGVAGQGKLIAKLSGEYRGHKITLAAYVSDGGRSNSVEYTQAVVEIINPTSLQLYSNLWEPLLQQQTKLVMLPHIKSGDTLFDLQYAFHGSSEVIAREILSKSAVRNGIKALYPSSTTIFEPPMLQLAGSQLAIRKYQSYGDGQGLTSLLDKVGDLAQVIETELQQSVREHNESKPSYDPPFSPR